MFVSSLTPFPTFAKRFRSFWVINNTLLFKRMFRDAFISVYIQAEGRQLEPLTSA